MPTNFPVKPINHSDDSSTNPTHPGPGGTGDVKAKPRANQAESFGSHLSAGAAQVGGEIKGIARNVTDDVARAAQSQLTPRKGQVADELRELARALRTTAASSQEGITEGIRPYVQRAAAQVDSASDYLQRRSIADMLADAEGFARREPALFLGGALVAGLIVGRFVRASSSAPRDNGASSSTASTLGTPSAGKPVLPHGVTL